MINISKINLNGVEYEIVDKATREAIDKINEPYIPYPRIQKDKIESQNISDTISDGFDVMDYLYFYFTSTNKDRVLYTKLGNTFHQNFVYPVSHLSNKVDELEKGEVITIHYGN